MKAEGEGDDIVGFRSTNNEKGYIYIYKGDNNDEDKDSREFIRKSKDEDRYYDKESDGN